MNRFATTLLFVLTALALPFARAADEVVLLTKTAKIEGAQARYDDGAAFKCIRDWRNTNIVVRWTFDVPAKGAYRVFLTYACPPEIAGAEVEVIVGNQRANGFTQSTGTWTTFKEFDLGPVLLRKPGSCELSVKGTRIVTKNIFDLRSVRLVHEQ